MSYTVSELSKISGVTVRTLHWYDEIGLLHPAYTTGSGYRHYEEEQLLQLQQILFFRELGLPLKRIKLLIRASDFDQARALRIQKETLKKRINHTKELIETIERTLLHLKGERKMSEKDFYKGLDTERQEEYEVYLVDYAGTVAEDLIAESKRRTKEWERGDWKAVEEEGKEIYHALAECIDRRVSERSEEVQELIERHYLMINRFYTANKDVYTGLAQLYCEHPGFVEYYERFHPKLAPFIAEAMRVWAQEKL